MLLAESLCRHLSRPLSMPLDSFRPKHMRALPQANSTCQFSMATPCRKAPCSEAPCQIAQPQCWCQAQGLAACRSLPVPQSQAAAVG